MADQHSEVADLNQAAERQGRLLTWLESAMPGPVDRVETHGAHILLGDGLAWKLKRAVRYPYLDFSTLDRRLAACQAELTLNRRTAPDLYLGLTPLLENPDGSFAMGPMLADGDDRPAKAVSGLPSATIIDWMVVMKRFPDDALLDRQAQAGGISFDTANALADAVIRLHQTVQPDHSLDATGILRQVTLDNGTELREQAGVVQGLDQALLDRLERRTSDALARLEPLLRQRQQDGFVRQGHGDLHLRNIIMVDGHPVLFDALEFDPALAITDRLYDLAFLLMDLESRGLRIAANAVLNRYRDATGETTGLALLPLFLSVRATIRAKVGLAASSFQSGDKGAALRDEALRYLELADRFLTPVPPRLLAVGGLSGSGKSRLARGLAPLAGQAPGAVILRSDALRKALWGKAETERLGEEAYRPEETKRVYATLLDAAGVILQTGFSVIADAVHAREAERRDIAAVALRAGVPFDGCWVETSLDRRVTRVTERRGNASDATADVARRQAGYELGTIDWHRIDSSGTVRQTLRAACTALGLSSAPSRPDPPTDFRSPAD